MDQAFEAQAPQVVGHLRGGVRAAEERCDVRAEVAVAEAARQMGEGAEGLEQRHHARVAEAQRGDALAGLDGGLLEAVEGVLGQHAVVTEALDLEQLAIDLVAEVAQVRQVGDGLADVEVLRVVDRGFGAEGVLLLEVLLDVRGLVLDVQAGLDAVGDHARAIAAGRRRRGRG